MPGLYISRGNFMGTKIMSIALGLVMTVVAQAQTSEVRKVSRSLTVTMSNADKNELFVYDTVTHERLQVLSTNGKGGVAGNAGGVRQLNNTLVGAVNNGSHSVQLFKRKNDGLVATSLVPVSDSPVSITFSQNHLYVAEATQVESFLLSSHGGVKRDGGTHLVLVGGAVPPVGSTAQVGLVPHSLLITLKTDPIPGTVDVVALNQAGAIIGAATPVSAPAGTLTPFGFSVLGDGTAIISLAHSGHVGLFRDGAFTSIIESGGQGGPCWTAKVGKYVLVTNTGSKSISRYVSSGEHVFLDNATAAAINTGGNPTDSDASGGYEAVLDAAATSHLSFFKVDRFGGLIADPNSVDLGVANANGVAVLGSN